MLQRRASGSAAETAERQRIIRGCCCPWAPTSRASLGVWYPGHWCHWIHSPFWKHRCAAAPPPSVCDLPAVTVPGMGKWERTECPGDAPRERGLSARQHRDAGEGCAGDTVLCPRKMQINTPLCHPDLYLSPRGELLWGLGKSHSITRFSGKAGGQKRHLPPFKSLKSWRPLCQRHINEITWSGLWHWDSFM